MKVKSPFILGFLFLPFLLTLGAGASVEYKKEWLGASNLRKMGLIHEAKQPPFTCYATSRETAERGLEVAVTACEKALENFGHTQRINKKCVICLWDDEEEYKKRASIYSLSARYAFAFAYRDVLPNTDAVFGFVRKDFFEETLPHEIGHIVIYNVADPSATTNLPSWLHEGFAQLQEGNLERSMEKARLRIVKAREDGDFLPLWQLTAPDKPAAGAGVFYSEALIFVNYLLENKPKEETFRDFCRYVARNRKKEFEDYFRSYYPRFKDIYDINDEWENSISGDLKEEAKKKLAASSEAVGKGRELLRQKKTADAVKQFRGAFHDLGILLFDYTKVDEVLFDEPRAWRLINACAVALRSASDKATTLGILPGDNIKKVKERLKGADKEEKGDWWNYDELGLSVRFDERDMVEEVKLSKSRAGKVGGIKVGDSLEDLLVLHGDYFPHRIEQMKDVFLKRAGQLLPGPDMDSFEEGSYPVLNASGKYMGNLVREVVDTNKEEWEQGSWYYVKPVISGDVVSLVKLDDEEISGIVLLRAAATERIFRQRIKEGSRRILPPDRKRTLQVGDKKGKLIGYLGKPKELKPYSIPEVSRTACSSLNRVRIKRELQEHLDLYKLEYPGLEVIVWDDDIISLWAREPSRASIYGVRIGDPLEKVTRLLGSTDDLVKYERKKLAARVDRKDAYINLFIGYEKGKHRITFKFDKEKRVSMIYAYASEWRGRRWGDTWIGK
ncbi:MAG: hypothetical protein P9M00_02675 [Candidatus Tritonobacter lacicola]|nr:hypothetical protein [Candidatus Tritonobacter lacicola]